jgi:hypothetical protein
MTDDIVDRIVEVTPTLDALRRRRPVTREQLQASFDALFRPVTIEHVSQAERELVAAFATGLAGADDATAGFYAARAQAADRSVPTPSWGSRGRTPRGSGMRRPMRSSPSSENDSPRPSRTRTCWCSGPVNRRVQTSAGCSMPAGRRTGS